MKTLLRAARRGSAAAMLAALLGAGASFGQVLLYVPAQGGNAVSEHGITTGNGNLTNFPTQTTGANGPTVVAVTPNNRFLYVGHTDGAIVAYAVSSDGTLTAVGPPIANAGSARGLAIEPGGNFLYASNGTGNEVRVFSINQTSGALTPLPALTQALPAASSPRGIETDGAGHLYVALFNGSAIAQFSLNSGTGALSPLTPATVAAPAGPNRIAIKPAGIGANSGAAYLYVTTSSNVAAFAIGGNGALSANGAAVVPGSGWAPLGITVHNNGQFLIVTDNGPNTANNVAVYAIPSNGQLSTPAQTGSTGTDSLTGVAVDPSGNFVYVSNFSANQITRFTINQTSGALAAPAPSVFPTGTGPMFLISRPAPPAPPPTPPIPAASTWSLALLSILLTGSSALLYRRAYR